MGYLVHLKTALVEAIKQTFDQDYPEADFRDIWTSIEYPVQPQNFPGIWVDYEDNGEVHIAGINHVEFSTPVDGAYRRYTRWRFTGYAQFTVMALSSLERDRLYDELVRVLAFGNYFADNPAINKFRNYVENNEFIAMNMDFDQIDPTGNAASPGTPWGTDEIVYERTINMELIGEFVSDGVTLELVPLSKVVFDIFPEQPDGTYTDTTTDYPGHPANKYGDPFSWQ